MTIKVAVVGTGYFSQFHFDGWSRLPEAKLVAVCSLDPAGLVDAAARHLIPRQFADVGAMLDATEPDLLDIVTPPSAHLAILEEAAGRGINVICQKPLGGDLATARAMVRIAQDAGITFVAHENFRFQPWYREARRLIDHGALGEVHNVGFRLRPGDGQGPRAYLERQPYFQEMPRFLIHETAIHMIDTFRFLLGEMSGVFARLRRLNPHIKGEDAGLVLFDFARGAAGVFDGNRLIDFVADDPAPDHGRDAARGCGRHAPARRLRPPLAEAAQGTRARARLRMAEPGLRRRLRACAAAARGRAPAGRGTARKQRRGVSAQPGDRGRDLPLRRVRPVGGAVSERDRSRSAEAHGAGHARRRTVPAPGSRSMVSGRSAHRPCARCEFARFIARGGWATRRCKVWMMPAPDFPGPSVSMEGSRRCRTWSSC
jgi:D-apiose dehydrogenase